MITVQNVSRHNLNRDQIALVTEWVGSGEFEVTPPQKPFFTSAGDVVGRLSGKVSVAVVPMALLLEAIWDLEPGTTILTFEADQAARKRGRFAASGMSVFVWDEHGPQLTWRRAYSPTVEQDFRTGEVFPYAGDGK